jgi:hypothetical protein
MADDDTVITIEPDLLSGLPPPKVEEPVEKPKVPEKTDDALAELKSQYDQIQRGKEQSDADAAQARQREADARAEAQRARAEAETARTQATDTHLSAIETSLAAQTAARDAAKKSYRAALESGNWDEATEAQERLATAVANITRLADAKDEISTRKVARPEPADDPAQRRPTDPVEAFMQSRTPTTQGWLRSHMDYTRAVGKFYAGQASAEEAKLARKLIAASSDAEAEGYAVDTPEYFAHLETFTGIKKTAEPKPEPQRTTRRQSVPAAPVNGGSSPSAASGGPVNVRLTKGQAETATDGSITWNRGDVLAKRCTQDQVGQPIGVHEMARRVYLMEQERPGIFTNGSVDQ